MLSRVLPVNRAFTLCGNTVERNSFLYFPPSLADLTLAQMNCSRCLKDADDDDVDDNNVDDNERCVQPQNA